MRVRRPAADPELLQARLQPLRSVDDGTRIRADRWERMGGAPGLLEDLGGSDDDPDDDPDDDLPPPLPRPGRHAAGARGEALQRGAAARTTSAAAGLVPPSLRGRVAIGPPQLAALALLVAVALAVTCWWVLSSRPQEQPVTTSTAVAGTPMADPATPSEASGAATSDGPAAAPPPDGAGEGGEADAGQVVVHVAGLVTRPGIVVLPVGARVAEAIEAAGGPRSGVDLTTVNLARPLVDGEQVLVGVDPAEGAPAPPAGSGGGGTGGSGVEGSGAPGGLVNLNTADLAALDTLPGVGPVTAEAIIAWRTENGGFSSVDELVEVSGIGDATLAKLAPLVTV